MIWNGFQYAAQDISLLTSLSDFRSRWLLNGDLSWRIPKLDWLIANNELIESYIY